MKYLRINENKITAVYNIFIDGCISVDNLPDDFYLFWSFGKYEWKDGIVITDYWKILTNEQVQVIIHPKEYWIETNWLYRMFVSTDLIVKIGDKMPQLLLALNDEPVNPKYTYNDGVMVYLNSINPYEMAALAYFGITESDIEHKPI